MLAVGLVVSAIVGYMTVKFFCGISRRIRSTVFAYYRFALAAVTRVVVVELSDRSELVPWPGCVAVS